MWTHCPGSRVAVPSLAFTLKAQPSPFGLATTFCLSLQNKAGEEAKGPAGMQTGNSLLGACIGNIWRPVEHSLQGSDPQTC